MLDMVFGFIIGFFLSLAVFIFLCMAFGPPGFEDKKITPINCVIDYHRDGIHYCILEDK